MHENNLESHISGTDTPNLSSRIFDMSQIADTRRSQIDPKKRSTSYQSSNYNPLSAKSIPKPQKPATSHRVGDKSNF